MRYQPLITIVIPVYNGKPFLSEAIDSALAQLYPNIEIIVVNDGSTDDGETDRIVRSYGDKVKYVQKENGGVSSALNAAIKEMKGEWLSWLSHDDLYYPIKIERQVAFLNALQSNDPAIDLERCVLHCATESIDKNGKVIKRPYYKDIPEKENTIDVILNNIYNYRLSGCSFLIPKSCFKKVGGFREDIRTVSDVEFWYRLLFAGYQFYCLSDEVLVRNRSHGNQVGKTKVGLFETELDALHVSIADRIAADDLLNSVQNYKKMYYGLIKRHMFNAAQYVKGKYIDGNITLVEKSIVFPIKTNYWMMRGTIRNMARDVFRKIYVR